jgi:hypothetical protein
LATAMLPGCLLQQAVGALLLLLLLLHQIYV